MSIVRIFWSNIKTPHDGRDSCNTDATLVGLKVNRMVP